MLGRSTIKPSKAVVAGSFVTINYKYHVTHPIDDSGCIKIVFRYAGDFGTPQFDSPAEPNFCSIATTGDCRILPRWDIKGHTRPWGKALYFRVTGGYLNEGDSVTIVFGDTSAGSPGWQMQTFCEQSFEFKTLVDPIASYQFKELPLSPTLRIIAGQPTKAVCIAPSQIVQNAKFSYHLKLEDQWGNPVRKPKKIKHTGFSSTGIETVATSDPKTGLSATSNPIRVIASQLSTPNSPQSTVHPPQSTPHSPLTPYWADFHGQSEETIGSNTIDEYLAFARDKALLDISGHQGNDFQVTDAFWEKINLVSDENTESGKFVVFPGYEWSGNTPLGGDRNVYFASNKGKITRSSNELLPDYASKYPVSATATELFRNLSSQKKATPFSFAHVGGRFADMSMHDPEIEVAMEIHSAWGTFEWLMTDALERGYRVGICANSDGHKGRPGASYPGASTFGSYGGLTCVLAPSLDRKQIQTAMHARHFYATTGNRLLMDVQLDAGASGKAIMGDLIEVDTETPILHGQVAGTAPIERIDVLNGTQTIKTIRPYTKADLGNRVKVVWSGAEVRGRARKVEWDGSLSITGNSIVNVEPINFWNAQNPLQQISAKHLEWRSITTGGVAGCIIDLKRSGGKLEINTKQGKVTCKLDSIGIAPKVKRFGGVEKQIALYRLPDQMTNEPVNFKLPLRDLHTGDNPIYIRVTQTDGHIAWSSPIYLIRA